MSTANNISNNRQRRAEHCNNYATCRDIAGILWNTKFQHCVYEDLHLPVSWATLIQSKLIYLISLRSIRIIFLNITVDFSKFSVSFRRGHQEPVCISLFRIHVVTCSPNHKFLDLISRLIFLDEYKSWRYWLCSSWYIFSSVSLSPNIFLGSRITTNS
jgi:hypothetical protein